MGYCNKIRVLSISNAISLYTAAIAMTVIREIG